MARNGLREDVGEKIGGARKDRWNFIVNRNFGELTTADFDEYCKKIKLWDLNSVKEIDDPFWRLCVLSMRDLFPSKPVFKKHSDLTKEELDLYKKEMSWLYIKNLESVKGLMEKGMDNYSKNAWEVLKELTKVDFTPNERVYLRNLISYKSSHFAGRDEDTDVLNEEMRNLIEENKEKVYFLINARNPAKSVLQALGNKRYLYQRAVDNIIKFGIKNKSIEFEGQKHDTYNLIEDLYLLNSNNSNWELEIEEWWNKAKQDKEFVKVFDFMVNSIVSPTKKQVLDKLESTKKSIKELKKEFNYIIKENIKQADYFQIQNVVREGYSWRKGKSIPSTKAFIDEFGFRGLEFGEWVASDKEREAVLNLAYDAFRDLGLALGIDKTELSLPPKFPHQKPLATAFGSRGVGRARAHFETMRNVFNLTRMKGAGSLAHEMGHAFEFYDNGVCATNINEYIKNYKSEEEKELMRSILYKDKNKEGHIKGLQKEYVDKFNEIAETCYDFGDWNEEEFKQKMLNFKSAVINLERDVLQGLEDKVKNLPEKDIRTILSFSRGYNGYVGLMNILETDDFEKQSPVTFKKYDDFIKKIKDVVIEVFPETLLDGFTGENLRRFIANLRIAADKIMTYEALEVINKNTANYQMEGGKLYSDYYNAAVDMDQANIKPYYSQPTELRARAFEMYVFEKLKEKGVSNFYLTKNEEHYAKSFRVAKLNFFSDEEMFGNTASLFPQGEEKERIIKAFDKVFLKYKQEIYPEQEIVLSHEIKGSKLRTIEEQKFQEEYEEFRNNLKNIKEPPKVQLSLF